MNWYFEVLNKYATFDGRAHREEYWMFSFISFVICILLIVLDLMVFRFDKGLVLYYVYSLFIFIPHIAVGVRRLHDTNRSGWWLLLPIVNFIFLVLDSQSGENRFGPNPKAGNANPSSRTTQPQANVLNQNQHNFVAVRENEFYETVASELDSGNTQKGLWTKIYAQCGGDEVKTKVRYIEQRVVQLTEEDLLKHSPVTKTELKENRSESGQETEMATIKSDEYSSYSVASLLREKLYTVKKHPYLLGVTIMILKNGNAAVKIDREIKVYGDEKLCLKAINNKSVSSKYSGGLIITLQADDVEDKTIQKDAAAKSFNFNDYKDLESKVESKIASAQFVMANFLLDGILIPANKSKALALLESAAINGHKDALALWNHLKGNPIQCPSCNAVNEPYLSTCFRCGNKIQLLKS